MRPTLIAVLFIVASAEEDAVTSGEVPDSAPGAHFFEPFQADWQANWKVSKDADFSGRWNLEEYQGTGIPGDKGLVVSDPAKKHAVSTLFAEPVVPETAGLVVQYELQLKKGLTCGGAYLKLLTASEELSHDGFKADTPYTIMFGPDKCGDTNKVHFILRHKSPVTGEWEEKHLVAPPLPDTLDKQTHLYTAIVGTDNSVKILVDGVEKKVASLTSATDFKPPINPPKEIDDPADSKPTDWVDEPKMDEPGAAKPDDWDEDAPRQIADPKAEKPSDWLDDAPDMVPESGATAPDDWDAEEDGEWEAPLVANPECKLHGCGEWKAPMVSNPEYKGKWYAPKVDNPEYKGVWSPRQIANPGFFSDEKPYAMAPIGGIGIELWTMQDGILFDNIFVGADPAAAAALADRTFKARKAAEDAAKKSASRELPKADGFVGQLKHWAFKAYYFALDNMLVVGASVCLGLIPLLLFCCFGGSSSKEEDDEAAEEEEVPADAGKEDEDEVVVEEDEVVVDKDEGEEEPEPKPKEAKAAKGKSGAKKRTPKA